MRASMLNLQRGCASHQLSTDRAVAASGPVSHPSELLLLHRACCSIIRFCHTVCLHWHARHGLQVTAMPFAQMLGLKDRPQPPPQVVATYRVRAQLWHEQPAVQATFRMRSLCKPAPVAHGTCKESHA